MKVLSPISAYRECAVEGANPVELVQMLYDAAIGSLRRALEALEAKNVEHRTAYLNHVLDVLCELQAALDFDRGGEVARSLSRFYSFARLRVLEANGWGSAEILRSLVEQFVALRDALAEAARSANSSGLAAGDKPLSEPAMLEAGKSPASEGWRA